MVWVDPPPPLRVALAFEDLHAEIERSWIKSHKLQRENMELSKKNRALNKKLKERDEMLNVNLGSDVCWNYCMCCTCCIFKAVSESSMFVVRDPL